SEVIAVDGTLAAHYEYAPFGAIINLTHNFMLAISPFRFSSEYADTIQGLVKSLCEEAAKKEE
ncbi:MAG: hypothetical protein ILO34_07275, partial [Kiritimatiellae bacterium]|nr:hypothetical protein [Kiritimatiellia bacterium]